MKKVFGLFLSLIVLMGLWSCEQELPEDSKKPNPEESMCLTFVSSGESSVTLVKVGKPFDISLEYSLDGTNWNPYTIGETIYLLEDKLSFRAGEQGNRRFSKGVDDYYQFVFSGEIAARGSIMSLLDRSCHKNAVPRYAFSGLFANCRSLTSAPELPAMELAVDCYASMFSGCTNLIDASALPATKLAEKCYSYMFSLCKNLTKAPELPATELAERCYWGMFSGCARLTEAPELPATELALHCYNYMFGLCESLTKAPALPATILAEGCYFGMFEYSNLVKAPVLPATELAQSCYRGMFWGCSNLTEAPELPATELVASCYSNMFGYCTGLTKAPELPATELTASCYYSMFEGCRNLKFVKALFTDKPSGEATKNWLSGVSYTGIFVKSKDATWDVRGDDGIPCRWTIVSDTGTSDDSQKPNPGETGCLTFVSSGGSSVTLVKVGKPYEITLEYSLDGNSWIPYTFGNTLNVIDGWELMFRAGEEGNANFSAGLENNYKFIFSGEIAARGNIMSLLDRSCHKNTVPRYAFSGLFANCRSLISAPELPATELAQDCYSFMFSGCTSLTKAPELPATELAEYCYWEIFEGCKNLTAVPALPATELAEGCYGSMFYGCTCLIEAPELPATELAEHCYSGMFNGCTSLTKAPELPATELDPYCYFEMFKGCTSLNYVKALFIYEPFNGATDNWLLGVSPTGTFVKSKDATWERRGSDGIPEGWTIESDAGTSDDPQKPNPDKPSYLTFVSTGESAVSLVKNGEPALITLEYSTNDSVWTPYTIGETISLLDGEKLMFRAGEQGNNFFSSNDENYYNFKITGSVAAKGNIMSLLDRSCHKNRVPRDAFSGLFANCWSLTSAPKLPAMKLDEECYSGMFSGCTNLTSAPELPSMKLAVLCYSGMFNGCTSLTSAPELPSMELAQNCYSYMFRGCTSLTEAPELPSMELADCCYYFMFNGCTSLTKAPVLPATELAFDCYNGMFYGCTSLNYVKALFTDKPSEETTGNWLSDVAPTGTFVKSKDARWKNCGIPEGWTIITE